MRAPLIFAALACAGGPAWGAGAGGVLSITGVSQPGAGGPLYLKVLDSDSDGDAVPDEGIVRIVCAGGELRAAHRPVGQPAAGGLGSHVNVAAIKEWTTATPQLAAIRAGYNVKENKGARIKADGGGWTAVDLSNAGGLCAAAQGAVATKSRSNIQNN